jgi:hypothetical protein
MLKVVILEDLGNYILCYLQLTNIILSSQWWMWHVILETDRIVIKQAVLSTNYDLTVDGGLSMEIRRLFYNDFISGGGGGHIKLLIFF